MILERCEGVHCVDLGESFPTSIFLQNLASIQLRTSPVKFACSPLTDPLGLSVADVSCSATGCHSAVDAVTLHPGIPLRPRVLVSTEARQGSAKGSGYVHVAAIPKVGAAEGGNGACFLFQAGPELGQPHLEREAF